MSTRLTASRALWVDLALLAAAGALLVAMVSLGNWQMRRLVWKTDLIERVDARAFAEPVPLPAGPVTEEGDAYRRLSATGTYLHDRAARVKAVTALGPGFWLMVPLRTEGRILWTNRGFVPTGTNRVGLYRPVGAVRVTGLLRLSEVGGTLLEDNDPIAGRWVSRDVAALTDAAGLLEALPYFVDADHEGAATDWPRGGLTQITFRNTHLAYALTWYAMAALFLGGMIVVIRSRINGTA